MLMDVSTFQRRVRSDLVRSDLVRSDLVRGHLVRRDLVMNRCRHHITPRRHMSHRTMARRGSTWS